MKLTAQKRKNDEILFEKTTHLGGAKARNTAQARRRTVVNRTTWSRTWWKGAVEFFDAMAPLTAARASRLELAGVCGPDGGHGSIEGAPGRPRTPGRSSGRPGLRGGLTGLPPSRHRFCAVWWSTGRNGGGDLAVLTHA